jgi:hypothetical protein
MHLSTPHTSKPGSDVRASAAGRMWTVNAATRITAVTDDGTLVVMPAGRYVLQELDEITYELHDSSSALLTLKLSEVARYWREGVLQIDGLWP